MASWDTHCCFIMHAIGSRVSNYLFKKCIYLFSIFKNTAAFFGLDFLGCSFLSHALTTSLRQISVHSKKAYLHLDQWLVAIHTLIATVIYIPFSFSEKCLRLLFLVINVDFHITSSWWSSMATTSPVGAPWKGFFNSVTASHVKLFYFLHVVCLFMKFVGFSIPPNTYQPQY